MDVITGRWELSFGPLQVRQKVFEKNVVSLVQIDTRLRVFFSYIDSRIWEILFTMQNITVFDIQLPRYTDIPEYNKTQHNTTQHNTTQHKCEVLNATL